MNKMGFHFRPDLNELPSSKLSPVLLLLDNSKIVMKYLLRGFLAVDLPHEQ